VSVKIPATRVVSRGGVNAAQSFFERHGCVFQEVAQQNDFGKDAYIDIAREGVMTHLCVALQIKSGESFRTAQGDYFIPIERHADSWRRSTVPVFGLVHDPSDQLLRWVDITGYLRGHPHQEAGSIPVSRDAVVSEASLHAEFGAAVSAYGVNNGAAIALSLLSDGDSQTEAVFDAWALGRHDARYLLLLRRLILDLHPPATRRAIGALAHAGDHPDIFWTKDNWIPNKITKQVRTSFRWSPEEIAHMIRAIDPEDWGRGTLGQSFDVLMYEDPHVVPKLHTAVGLMLGTRDPIAAVRAATVALSHSRDARQELSLLIQEQPTLMDHEWFREIAAAVQEFGNFSLY
jgi:hypothetical protein